MKKQTITSVPACRQATAERLRGIDDYVKSIIETCQEQIELYDYDSRFAPDVQSCIRREAEQMVRQDLEAFIETVLETLLESEPALQNLAAGQLAREVICDLDGRSILRKSSGGEF